MKFPIYTSVLVFVFFLTWIFPKGEYTLNWLFFIGIITPYAVFHLIFKYKTKLSKPVFIVSIVILIVTAFGLDLSTNIKSFFVGGSFSILPSLLLIVYLNFPRSGEIIMSMAIADGFLFIVVWLHKIGVSLSNRGLLELTPLETAKHYNHDNIATYIIKHTT